MILLTLSALLLGVICGLNVPDNIIVSMLSENSDIILYILMFSVGISIGMQDGIFRKLKDYNIKIFIIPLGIIIGSTLGGLVCSLLLNVPVFKGMAVADGMGWYSLSGVTVGKLGGAELGSIAFMSNLMREIFSFMLIPFLAKLGPFCCIASAGATSEDTTLPIILKYTNEETVVLSVINGAVCSFFVPILISLWFGFV